ncbi:MAG: THUMP domain-containing protein, partial [Quisquiliibacterium sp.]
MLLQVAQGRYRDDDDLYRLANRIEWERWFSSDQTVRVDLNAIRSIYEQAGMRRAAGEDVHVDHVIPLRGKTVCGLHIAENLQIIA